MKFIREIARSKKRMHIWLIVFAILSMGNMLVLSNFESAGILAIPAIVLEVLTLLISLCLHVLHVMFISNIFSKSFTRVYGVVLFVAFFTAGPFLEMSMTELQSDGTSQTIFVLAMFIQIVQVIFLFCMVIKDAIYARDTNYRFIAAADAFVFIPMVTGMLYWLVSAIASENLFGLPESAVLADYLYSSVQFSCFSVAGMDSVNHVHPLIKNMGAMEGIFSQLYMVILVGMMLNQNAGTATKSK